MGTVEEGISRLEEGIKRILSGAFDLATSLHSETGDQKTVFELLEYIKERKRWFEKENREVPLDIKNILERLSLYALELVRENQELLHNTGRLYDVGIHLHFSRDQYVETGTRSIMSDFDRLVKIATEGRVEEAIAAREAEYRQREEEMARQLSQQQLQYLISTAPYRTRVLSLFVERGMTEVTSRQLLEMGLIEEFTKVEQYGNLLRGMSHTDPGLLERTRPNRTSPSYGITEKGRSHYRTNVQSQAT